MIRAYLPLRGVDKHGSGEYGAPRVGGRLHKGVDFACWPGTIILSPVVGTVTKLGYPYADDLSFRYVEVTDSRTRKRHRVFYVEPCVRVGQIVSTTDPIGAAQDLRPRYDGITPHVHYEIKVGPRTWVVPRIHEVIR